MELGKSIGSPDVLGALPEQLVVQAYTSYHSMPTIDSKSKKDQD